MGMQLKPPPHFLLMLTNGGAVGGEVELLAKSGGVNEFHHTAEFVPLSLS